MSTAQPPAASLTPEQLSAPGRERSPQDRSAPLPENEPQRLSTLRRYRILDTHPEQAFDDLARLAALICGTPIALISFVDSDRQWFKARVGLATLETPRQISFCAHAILRPDELMVVPDTLQDERFCANTLVLGEPYIRFYAGAPLVVSDGMPLGTLCVIDTVPHQLSQSQVEALEALCRSVVSELELRMLSSDIAFHQSALYTVLNQLTHELNPDLIIQQAVQAITRLGRWESVAISLPTSDGQHWQTRAASFLQVAQMGQIYSTNKGVVGKVYRSGQLQHLADVRADPDFFADDTVGQVCCELAVPIKFDGQVLGVLNLESAQPGAFGEGDRAFAQSVAELLGIALKNAQRFAALRHEEQKTEDDLRQSQADLQNFLDTASDLIEILDIVGRISYVNGAWCKTLGYEPDEVRRMHALEIIDPDYHDYCRMVWVSAYATGQTRQLEVVFRTKWGEAVILEGSISVRKNKAGQPLTNAIFRDVTRRRQAEEALRVANAEMERALRTKDEFLANMSHELRTPLNAILALSESLLEEARGPLNERQHESLSHIETSGRHLLALINDILDLSKVEAGRLELQIEAVPASEVCRASLQFVKEVALKKRLDLSLRLSDELDVEADPKRLKQMLVNLLSNAVKFTPAEGKVSLEVATGPDGASINFIVRDTGIGIRPEDIPRLFRPFTQLDSSLSRQHEGTGLGLTLVRRLAELHGGSIAVESEPGRGSCFTITLPYRALPSAKLSAATAAPGLYTSQPVRHQAPAGVLYPSPRRSEARVLVVEDNEVNLEVVRDYLQEKGYAVVVARTGREALDQAHAAQPDVILMDIQMPEMDGLEAIKQLRTRSSSAKTPIIALTALAMTGDRERCLAAGANAYLTKPVRLKELVGTIESLLR